MLPNAQACACDHRHFDHLSSVALEHKSDCDESYNFGNVFSYCRFFFSTTKKTSFSAPPAHHSPEEPDARRHLPIFRNLIRPWWDFSFLWETLWPNLEKSWLHKSTRLQVIPNRLKTRENSKLVRYYFNLFSFILLIKSYHRFMSSPIMYLPWNFQIIFWRAILEKNRWNLLGISISLNQHICQSGSSQTP